MDFKYAKKNRRLDYFVVVLLLLILTCSLNFVISKIDHQVDLTPKSRYSLSPESLALLNKMESPVDLIITLPEDTGMPKIVQRLLHDLELLFDAFTRTDTPYPIRVYRLNVNSPRQSNDILTRYKITQPNLILVGSPDKGIRKIFHYKEEMGTNPYDSSQSFRSSESLARQAIWEAGFYSEWKEGTNGLLEPQKFRGEEVFTKAILDLSDDSARKKVAYFTRGHGESSPNDSHPKDGNSFLSDLFVDRNIDVASVDLSTLESIPADASFLVVSGPKAVFLDKEVSMIRDFLIRGGGCLILAIDPMEDLSVSNYPAFGFRPILKEWGLRCHDMLIHDPVRENFDLFSGSYFLRTYLKEGNHPLVKNIMDEGISILAGRCRHVETDPNSTPNFLVEELLFSSRESWALSSWAERSSPPKKNPLLDISGPVPVLAVSKPNPESSDSLGIATTAKILVLGCSKILSNGKLRSSSGNQALARNIIYWIDENHQMLEIPPKDLQFFHINMSTNEFKSLFYYFSAVPCFVVVLGLLVNWLRKEL